MNIVDAFKSGKKIKRDTWDEYLTPSEVCAPGLLPSAIVADDWEVEEDRISKASKNFKKAWNKALVRLPNEFSLGMLYAELCKELGLEIIEG